MTMLTMSFMRVAEPMWPQWTLSLPIAARSSAASRDSASSPPVMKTSVPCSAGPLLPETGASRKRPPRWVTAAPLVIMSSGRNVAQSMISFPSLTPERTPSGISYTDAAASGVESIRYVRQQASTTCLGVSTTVTAGSRCSASGPASCAAICCHSSRSS